MSKTLSKKKKESQAPPVGLAKIISDFTGKDERILMFRKVKGKLFMFDIETQTMGKIPMEKEPKTYPASDFKNLGAFLYKLILQEKANKKTRTKDPKPFPLYTQL